MKFQEYLEVFARHGNPGEEYLRETFPRFLITKSLATEGSVAPLRVLDVGAHWLHNSTLYAMDGHKVTAADLPGMSGGEMAEGVALEFGIERLHYENLSDPAELVKLGKNVFDIILFTEIIEHITFNPVRMWSVFYDLLKPGGKIIITTPNYHHFLEFLRRDIFGFLRGKSAGITVSDILQINTYGHHWKIFSARDMREYFRTLSPDLEISKLRFFDYMPKRTKFAVKVMTFVQRLLPVFREALYVEVHVREKKSGITITPHW